jgi:hypothetical protein
MLLDCSAVVAVEIARPGDLPGWLGLAVWQQVDVAPVLLTVVVASLRMVVWSLFNHEIHSIGTATSRW